MAVDHKDDDNNRDDDEEGLVPIRRQPKSLVARKSLPSVENALDDFIISANQKSLDVAEFTQETREQQLRDEIAALKTKLAAAETRAEAASAIEVPVAKRSWGAIIGAFVIGGASMFAINLAMKPKDAKPSAAAVEPTATAPVSGTEPTPAPRVEPIVEPTPTPTTTTTTTAPTTSPTTTANVATRPPTTTAANKVPVTKQPKQPKQRPAETTRDETPPKQPPKPPEKGSGEGGDLYNPF